jgi:hypothetical protein
VRWIATRVLVARDKKNWRIVDVLFDAVIRGNGIKSFKFPRVIGCAVFR